MDKELREMFCRYCRERLHTCHLCARPNDFIKLLTDKYYLLEKKKVIKLNRFHDKRYECFCESGNCIAKSDNCKQGTLYFVEDKETEIKDAEGQETRKCKSCGRVGCWMTTDDPKYIQCKCGNEEDK